MCIQRRINLVNVPPPPQGWRDKGDLGAHLARFLLRPRVMYFSLFSDLRSTRSHSAAGCHARTFSWYVGVDQWFALKIRRRDGAQRFRLSKNRTPPRNPCGRYVVNAPYDIQKNCIRHWQHAHLAAAVRSRFAV